MHCVLNHLRRGKGHNPQKSNIAADYECNITLSDASGCMKLFKQSTIKNIGGYIDSKYASWGYEKIYADVKDTSNDSQDNSGDSNKAKNNQQLSDDYVSGWNQAMEDYKNGKLKI